MTVSYSQFCTVARGAEALCERWTPLVVRELLCGSRRFNDLHRGVPRMSTSLLAQRLRRLAGALAGFDGRDQQRAEGFGLLAHGLGLRGLDRQHGRSVNALSTRFTGCAARFSRRLRAGRLTLGRHFFRPWHRRV